MPIQKTYSAPNGAAPTFHVLKKLEVVFPATHASALVQSYANEGSFIAGSGAIWNTAVSIPILVLAAGVPTGVEDWLIASEDSPFFNGSVIGDATDTIGSAKSRAWAGIKAQREARMNGTFTHAGNTYDIDPVNLSGASIDAREALIAEEVWSQMWVLADNTVVTLTAAEMIALGRACKTVVSNLWGMSQYLRGLVDAATTVEEVEAVVWP